MRLIESMLERHGRQSLNQSQKPHTQERRVGHPAGDCAGREVAAGCDADRARWQTVGYGGARPRKGSVAGTAGNGKRRDRRQERRCARLPGDPRKSEGKEPHVTVSVPSHPGIRAELDIPVRYNYPFLSDFSGRASNSGSDGSDGTDGTSGTWGSSDPNNPSAGGDGTDGGPGGDGQRGDDG